MYQMLGDEVYDSQEVSRQIQEGTIFRVREDMSRRTKRDDAIAFKLSIAVKELDQNSTRYIEEEETIDELMRLADQRCRMQVEKLSLKEICWEVYAYRYDEVENEILLVAAMMSRLNARRKLPDVMRRLLTQI